MSEHSFSRTFAKQHSINEAIVLELLAFKTRTSPNTRKGKMWYYDSTDELQKKLPYLGRSTVDDVVNKLAAKSLLVIENHNKASFDKTRWFHVGEEHWDAANDEKVWFDPADAEAHGVPAALLMKNLEYWLTLKIRAGEGPTHKMSPTNLAKSLPMSVSTIKATLTAMVNKRVLVKTAGKNSEYAFSADRMRDIETVALLP
jgi:hypothetical protein